MVSTSFLLVLDKYKETINASWLLFGASPVRCDEFSESMTFRRRANHLLWMISILRSGDDNPYTDKAFKKAEEMEWLHFIQGCLWGMFLVDKVNITVDKLQKDKDQADSND